MLKLIKKGNSLLVQGENNSFYPNDGDNSYPLNSITLVIDESDMVTFRSVATNDVLFSGLIKDITINGSAVTKDNIIQKFDEISNASTGGGSSSAVNSVNGMTGDVVIDIPDTSTLATKEEVNTLSTTVEELSGEVAVNKTDIQTIKTKQTEDGTKINSLVNDVGNAQNDISVIEVDVADINRELRKKQDKLVSGTNIKTINNESILGSGNIEITGGGGSSAKEWVLNNVDFLSELTDFSICFMYKTYIVDGINYNDIKLGDILVDKSGNKTVITMKDKLCLYGNFQYFFNGDSQQINMSRAVSIRRINDTSVNVTVKTTLPQKYKGKKMYYGVDSETLDKIFGATNYFRGYGNYDIVPSNFNYFGVGVLGNILINKEETLTSSDYNALNTAFYVNTGTEYNSSMRGTKIVSSPKNLDYFIVTNGSSICTTDSNGNWVFMLNSEFEASTFYNSSIYCVEDRTIVKQTYELGCTLEVGKTYVFYSENNGDSYALSGLEYSTPQPSVISYKENVQTEVSNQLYNISNDKIYNIRNEANEWVGTQAQYDALKNKKDYIIYYITE